MLAEQFRASANVRAALVALAFITCSLAQEQPNKPAPRTMRLTVLDADDKPLAGVHIFASASDSKTVANHDYTTDAEGKATAELPQKIDLLRIWATKNSCVGMFAQWWPEHQADGHLIPDEYTFHLAKGTTIGGIVKNDAGEPIRGAKVQAQLIQTGAGGLGIRLCENTWLAYGEDARVTDAEGRWSLDNVPAGDDVNVSLMLDHSDYIGEPTWGTLQQAQSVTMESLRAKSATIVMHWGSPITGTVKDADGKPVAGAVVIWGGRSLFSGRQPGSANRR